MELFSWILLATVMSATTATTSIGSLAYQQYCGLVTSSYPRNCLDLRCHHYIYSGVYTVYPQGTPHLALEVYCDQKTDGGGWMVFQRRMNGKTDFYREWQSYKLGFGEPRGEHWLGLENLYILLSVYSTHEIRFDLEDWDGVRKYAKYDRFNIAAENDGYRASVSTYSGDAGNSFQSVNGLRFSTRDRDQDRWPRSCAQVFVGAWWYSACHSSNLNGGYLRGNHTTYANGVNWGLWKGQYYSLKTTEMKIRPEL